MVRSIQDLLSMYEHGLEAEEQWLEQMQKTVASQPPLTGDVVDAKNQLQTTMVRAWKQISLCRHKNTGYADNFLCG